MYEDDHTTTPDSSDPWGPYRDEVEQAVENCADYLGRIQRSLGAEIPGTDRFSVREKARYLQVAATALVGRIYDIEGWLNECGATWEEGPPEARRIERCELAAGHDGEHRCPPPPSDRERAITAAQELENATMRLAHHLREVALRPFEPGEEGELQAGAATLRSLADRVAAAVGELA